MAMLDAKYKPCPRCGKARRVPDGPPRQRTERDKHDSKNFVLCVRVKFQCPCGWKGAYLQRSWHDRATGEKVTPEYSLNAGRA